MSKRKISILIPVFNGANYLIETLNSIISQKFSDYDVILINDCSTDNSLSILRRFEESDPRFRVFTTPRNFGIVPPVLNFVINHINSDYFVYSSQDDIFSTDWLASMYEKAVETNADAVIPDLVFYYGEENAKNRLLSGVFGDKNRVLESKEAFHLSLDWTIPGNALWKTWLIKKYNYFDFGMNADEYTARYYFLHCNKIVFSAGTFFYRQNNSGAITKNLSLKTFDIPYTDFRLWKLAKDFGSPKEIQVNLICRSIRGLIIYSSFTFFGKFKSGRSKINDCHESVSLANVLNWLKLNTKKSDLLLEKAVASSLGLLYLLGFMQFIRRSIKKPFNL